MNPRSPWLGAAAVAALLLAWTAAQGLWLAQDERLPDGDEMGNVGAVELFWGYAHAESVPRVLERAYLEDFGEYPAAYPALVGVAAARAGVDDLDGDGPAAVAMAFGWLTAIATAALAAGLALRGGVPVGATTRFALLLLLGSPLWSALQRHVMLENAVCAGTVAAAACAVWARILEDQGSTRRVWVLWAGAGLAAALALLSKQTAVLALAPLAVAFAVAEARADAAPPGSAATSPGRRRAGPAVALLVAVAAAAPWYVGRLGSEGGYLLRSAAANPDSVGALHQALVYPAVLLQQAWAPGSWVAFAAGAAFAARGTLGPRARREMILCAGTVAVGLLVLLVIPKKYARLLLPLLPFVAVAAALEAGRWPARLRWAVAVVVVGSWAVGSFAPTSVPAPLRTTELGLTGLDERCVQRWIEAPDPSAPPWRELLTGIEAAGGRDRAVRVGAIRWPVPPCAHQTTHDLGEHLRIRARRAGLEAWIAAGVGWTAEGGWTSEDRRPPEVLLHEGPLEDAVWSAACGRAGPAPSPLASTPARGPTAEPSSAAAVGGWHLDAALFPCAR